MRIFTCITGLVFLLAANVKAQTPPPGFSVTGKGLVYRLIKASDTACKTKSGDIITFNFIAKNSRDSVFMNSYNQNSLAVVPVFPPTYNGCIFEGLGMMNKGDSALFIVNADSLYRYTFRQERPGFIRPGEHICFSVKMLDVATKEQMELRSAEEVKEKLSREEAGINKWVKGHKLTFTSTKSGLRYAVTRKTGGKQVKTGNTVMVHYTGKFLDGTGFDSSAGKEPYPVKIGSGQVIEGWEEGLPLLKEGEKAILIVPFELGYGERGMTSVIPPFATLIFEVELVKIVN